MVDRAIIRLAYFEMRYRPDITFKISLNEAIEIAKSFGESESRVFVNGVLDKLKDLLPGVDSLPEVATDPSAEEGSAILSVGASDPLSEGVPDALSGGASEHLAEGLPATISEEVPATFTEEVPDTCVAGMPDTNTEGVSDTCTEGFLDSFPKTEAGSFAGGTSVNIAGHEAERQTESLQDTSENPKESQASELHKD
jgi:hypothetical protein